MVEVLCPLCDKEVDLGVDASGEYECPYCEGNFDYESESKGFDNLAQYIEDIEAGRIEPDFVIKNYSYKETAFSKVISLLIAIPFILIGVGLIMIYFILKEPLKTEHFAENIIYNQKNDAIVFYETRNGIITECSYLEIADDAIIRLNSHSTEGGSGTYSMLSITSRSKGIREMFDSGFFYTYSDWNDFAEYRGLRYSGNYN